jgi:hypothetical protein
VVDDVKVKEGKQVCSLSFAIVSIDLSFSLAQGTLVIVTVKLSISNEQNELCLTEVRHPFRLCILDLEILFLLVVSSRNKTTLSIQNGFAGARFHLPQRQVIDAACCACWLFHPYSPHRPGPVSFSARRRP